MLKMLAILMAQRMPSRHRDATSGSSQSCSPTLNAASRGVHASYGRTQIMGWRTSSDTSAYRASL